MVRCASAQHSPRKVRRITLPSGRDVQIDRMDHCGDQSCHDFDQTDADSVIVRVGQGDVWYSRTLPVKSFPFFGRPLAQRIREAIIQLDTPPPDESGSNIVEEAVMAALFSGGPVEEGPYTTRREPPLVSRRPPPPPPPPKRGARE